MVKKTDLKDAEKIVYDFLEEQNRPYSAILLLTSLKGKLKKKLATDALTSLAESGQLTEKVFGKSKIYWLNQAEIEQIDEDGIRNLDAQIKELRAENAELKSTYNSLDTELKRLNHALTDEQLDEKISALECQFEVLSKKLESLQEAASSTDEDAVKELRLKYEKMVKLWQKRKRMCKDIFSTIEEGTGKKYKDWKKELDIEDDDDFRVNPKETRIEKRKREAAAELALTNKTKKRRK